MFQSLSLPAYTGLLGTWLTLTVHHSMLNFPVLKSSCFDVTYACWYRTVVPTLLSMEPFHTISKVIKPFSNLKHILKNG